MFPTLWRTRREQWINVLFYCSSEIIFEKSFYMYNTVCFIYLYCQMSVDWCSCHISSDAFKRCVCHSEIKFQSLGFTLRRKKNKHLFHYKHNHEVIELLKYCCCCRILWDCFFYLCIDAACFMLSSPILRSQTCYIRKPNFHMIQSHPFEHFTFTIFYNWSFISNHTLILSHFYYILYSPELIWH